MSDNRVDNTIDKVVDEIGSSKYVKKSSSFLKELLKNTIYAIIIFVSIGFTLKALGFDVN